MFAQQRIALIDVEGAADKVLKGAEKALASAVAVLIDPDYYAQTNSDDLILDKPELEWLRTTLGSRIAVYDHGGHLGNLGDRRQIADMLDMLAGRWQGQAHVAGAAMTAATSCAATAAGTPALPPS